MERLTEWTGEEWIPRQERLNGKLVGHKDCMKRLAAYEDTGHEPEQIREFEKLYLEKCQEMNDLRKRIEQLKHTEVRKFECRLPDGRICHFSDFIEFLERGEVE